MTGKHNKHLRANNLSLSQGGDGVWRVRSPEKPHRILKEAPTQEEAFKWAHDHREFAHRPPEWTMDDLDYLVENYGLLPVEKICKHLGRTRNALKIASYRKQHGQLNQRTNIHTARLVAKLVGVS